MKTVKIIAGILLMGLVLFTAYFGTDVGYRTVSTNRGLAETVAYLSDIDRMATDIVIYGMTNGIVINGTNYVLVVEPTEAVVPPGPSGPVHTIITFDDDSTQTIEKSGTLTLDDMVSAGLYDNENNEWVKSPIMVTIGTEVTVIDGAFRECGSLTTVEMPNSVRTIGNNAFQYCYSLEFITFSDSLESIGEGAFSSCCFSSLTFPNSLTSIGTSAFDACLNLTSVICPDSLTQIPDSIFEGCESLTSVTLGNSVTSIGSYSFHGCDLTSITLGRTITEIGVEAFLDCNNFSTVYVSAGDTNRIRQLFEDAEIDISGITFIEQ